ncbi:MAG: carboxymuconolactone decarboxylase family protein [Promethearchaeota archaeon]
MEKNKLEENSRLSKPRIPPAEISEFPDEARMVLNAFKITKPEDLVNLEVNFSELDEEVKKLYEDYNLTDPTKIKFFLGVMLSNMSRTLVNNSNISETIGKFATYITMGSSLPPRDREILIIRIAWLCKSEFELAAHLPLGVRLGLTGEEAYQILKGAEFEGWKPLDLALIHAADELHLNTFISGETWEILSQYYNKEQLMEVIFTVGHYNTMAMFLKSVGVQLDPNMKYFEPYFDKLLEDIDACKNEFITLCTYF